MSKLIMVIDDSQEILELYETLLTDEGYRVKLGRLGLDDLEQVKQAMPDLLIVDLLFKGQQIGWQLVQKVRMDDATAVLPIILCTADGRRVADLNQQLLENNVTPILKPFDIADFLKAVESILAPSLTG